MATATIATMDTMADLLYEVSFKGIAGETVRSAFDEFDVSAGAGITLVRCPQPALRRVITLVEELGLDLLTVHLVADRGVDRPRLDGV